jgi:hypothetical protein
MKTILDVSVDKGGVEEGRKVGILNLAVENKTMQTYNLTNRYKYRYLLLGSLVYSFMWGLFAYIARGTCILIYFLGAGTVSIFLLIYKNSQEHVVVSEKGIEYSRPGLILEAKWEGVSKVATYWHQGFRQECLLIDNSQVRIKKWSLGSIPGPFEFVPRNTIIPLSCFSDNWRDSELGQQIKQYAPHLFQ